MFKKQVKIVVKKTDYNKTANNIELIQKLISPKVILFKCDGKYGRKQKWKSWVYTYKEKWNETGITRRNIFEACERCVSNPDSETEFETIFKQCESEKSKKVKIKENGDMKSHQT